MVALTKPSIGDTDWGTSVNQNWTDIENEMNGARPVSTGGTGGSTAFTQGSVVFAGASGIYSQDNSNLFWDSTNKRLGLKTASPVATLHVACEASGDSYRGIMVSQHNAGPDSPVIWTRKSRGTLASPAAASNGDYTAALVPYVYDGSTYQQSGYIAFVINGGVSSGYVPGDFVICTTYNTGGTERLRVDSVGRVGIGAGSNLSDQLEIRLGSGATHLNLSMSTTNYVKFQCGNYSNYVILPSTQGSGQNMLFRTSSVITSSVGNFVMASGTAPNINYMQPDAAQLWVADRGGTAGKAGFHMVAEDATLYVFSDLCGIGTSSPSARCHVQGPTIDSEVFRVETVATNSYPNYRIFQGRVATTDATVTTIDTIAISASNTYLIEARVVARRTGGGSGSADDGAAYIVRGIYKTVSGTVTLIGSVTTDFSGEDQAGWDATLSISGTNVLVRVTGAASNNVTWHSTVIVQNLGT